MLGSIAMMKHHDQKQEKVVYFIWHTLLHHTPYIKEVRVGAWKQELIQRAWSGAAYLLAAQPAVL